MEGYGRFQAYYNRIRSEVEAIKADNKYSNLSKAFAHWYLERNENLSEQELGECIIDGFGDNGIDAITYKDNTMTLFQFKFPDRIKNIDKCIDEITALKLINGYNKLTANRKPSTSNERFMAYREIAKTTDIFSYRMVFVSFQQGFSGPARDAIDASISEVKRITGNDLHVNVFEKKNLCDLYDKSQRKNNIQVDFIYSKLDQSYNLDSKANSWVGFANAKKLLEAINSSIDVIFD